MAKKNNGIELPTTEPQLEQPEEVTHADINMDNDAIALMAATIFASRVNMGSDTEQVARRQQAIDFSVQAALDIAQSVADKRST